MATRFCSPDSEGDEFVCGGACARSSGRTGLALRTSGSLGAGGAAATAIRTTVGPTEADGATVGADAIAPGEASVAPGCPTFGLGTGDALGATCAVDSPFPGASRCTLRINFITEKPITNTSTPKMSGIGEIRSWLVVVGRRRRITGALTGFSGRFSWRYEETSTVTRSTSST